MEEIGLFDEVKAVSVRTVNGKRHNSDEETLREMEFAETCEELVEAEREFTGWDANAGKRWAHPDSARRTCANGSIPLSGGTAPTGTVGAFYRVIGITKHCEGDASPAGHC